MSRTTLMDVAARAGVSVKTVSRVVNDEPNVSAQTTAAVKAAIAELAFVPNVAARRLSSGRALAIGLISGWRVSSPYSTALIDRVFLEANRRDYALQLFASTEGLEKHVIDALMGRQVDGFILDGLNYIFPDNTVLAAGAVLLLGSSANPGAFAVRYPGAVVAGYFGGNLSNGGERLALLDQTGTTVVAVHYDDENGWPTSPDGGGFSLEIIDPRGDPNAPANWRASSAVNGTPGAAPGAPAASDIVFNEVMADNAGSVTNGGAFPDWI